MSAAAAAPAGDAAPKKGKKKLIIIIAAVVLLLAVAGGGTMVYLNKKHAAEEAAAAEEGEGGGHAEKKPKKEKKKKEEKHAPPVFVPLDPFVVNLADREADRYAQIGITLEVEDAHASDEIKAYLPAIRNNILLLLAHKTSQEISSAEGKEKLARQVLRQAVLPMGIELEDEDAPEPEAGKKNKRKYDSIDDAPIKSVQFSSFIIQ